MPPSFSNKTSTYSEWKLLTSKVLGCFCPVFLSLDVLFICGLWSTSLWTFGFPIRRVARCLFHTWSTKHVKHASPLCTYRNAKQNNVCCKARAFASAYAMQQLLSSKKRADRVQADEQALQSLCSSDCFQYKVSPKIRSWEIPPLAVIQTHINTFMWLRHPF